MREHDQLITNIIQEKHFQHFCSVITEIYQCFKPDL